MTIPGSMNIQTMAHLVQNKKRGVIPSFSLKAYIILPAQQNQFHQ